MKGGEKVVEIAVAGEVASVKPGVVAIGDVVSMLAGQGFGSWGIPVEPCGRSCEKNGLGSALKPML